MVVEPDLTMINNLRNEGIAAVNAGDTSALAGLYTDDGVLMPPNAPVVIGKDAIRRLLETALAPFNIEETACCEELEVAGDWAFERGTYTDLFTPKVGGDQKQVSGAYLSILQRQPDGSWKIARHIFNSDQPVPDTRE